MSLRGQVAVVGVYATEQRRELGRSALSACVEAALGAIRDAGLRVSDIDGIAARWPGPGGTVMHPGSLDWSTMLGLPLRWYQDSYPQGVPAALDAAAAIGAGLCRTVLVVGGQAAIRDLAGSVAAYTRPENEFVAPWGAFTAVHFAMLAQRYLHEFPQARAAAAEIAATIRNRGHVNPAAIMYGRGPYTPEAVLRAAPIATPLTLLDLCLATEGAAAMVLSRRDVANDTRSPVWLLGGGCDWHQQQYVNPPRYEDVWGIGTDAARRSFAMAGVSPADIDVAQLYDINSFEVLRQLEVLGYCRRGEASDCVKALGLGPGGRLPINTDGGLMSYSHIGWGGPTLKIVEAVHQLRHEAGARQVPNARLALASGAGAGAQYYNVLILGRERP